MFERKKKHLYLSYHSINDCYYENIHKIRLGLRHATYSYWLSWTGLNSHIKICVICCSCRLRAYSNTGPYALDVTYPAKNKTFIAKSFRKGLKWMLLSFTTKNLCMANSMSLPQKYNKQNLTHRETTLAPAVAIKLSSLLIDMRRKKK